jgi:TonB family protein
LDQEKTYKWIQDRLRELNAGTINDADFRQLESIAKDDPFVADALEGYQVHAQTDHATYLESLTTKINSQKRERRRWLIPNLTVTAVAASLMIIVGLYAVITRMDKNESPNLAAATEHELSIGKPGDTLGLYSPGESANENKEPDPPIASAQESPSALPTTPSSRDSHSKNQSSNPIESKQSNSVKSSEDLADGKIITESAPSGHVSATMKEEERVMTPTEKAGDKDMAYYANQMDPTIMAQRVTGRVISQNGEPLIGANLLVQGTNLGTVSQSDGKFELYLPKGDTPVDVVYGGYVDQEINLKPGDEDVEIRLDALSSPISTSVMAGAASKNKRADNASPKMSTVDIQADDNLLFVDYLKTNSKYPLAENLNIPAKTVLLEFIVNTDGHPSQVKVIESSHDKALDDEAVRLIRKGPDWECKVAYPCKVNYRIYFRS